MERILVAPRVPGRRFFIGWLGSVFAGTLALLLLIDPLGPRVVVVAPPGPPPPSGVFVEEPLPALPDLRPRLDAALDWLARHQSTDGSWQARYFGQMCEKVYCTGRGTDDHDVGITALALLAFLESGRARRHERSVDRALVWLRRQVDPRTGRCGPDAGKYMYDHALATLAFSRAYALLGHQEEPGYIRACVRFLLSAKNPGQVWRYDVQTGRNDTSVTGWVGEALFAARASGARLDPHDPDAVDRDIVAWLDSVTDDDGTVAYSRRGYDSAAQRGYAANESLAAAALGLRLAAGQSPAAPELAGAVRRLALDLPAWSADGSTVDFNYWYQGTQALARCRRAHPDPWARWSDRAARRLLERQRGARDECLAGSWDPSDKWGGEGGRVYATAVNALTLARIAGVR